MGTSVFASVHRGNVVSAPLSDINFHGPLIDSKFIHIYVEMYAQPSTQRHYRIEQFWCNGSLTKMKKVLIGIDGSENSTYALTVCVGNICFTNC